MTAAEKSIEPGRRRVTLTVFIDHDPKAETLEALHQMTWAALSRRWPTRRVEVTTLLSDLQE